MLRVIIDSPNKASDEMIDSVNIQRVSINGIVSNITSLKRFKKYIDKCLFEGDRVIVITLINTSFAKEDIELNDESFKIINTSFIERSTDLIIKEIIKYKGESLEYIEKRIYSLEKMFRLVLVAISGF